MSSSSLISRLFRVRPTERRLPLEDFFTEAFAHLLATHDDVLRDFIKRFAGVAPTAEVSLFVRTQVSLKGLDDHTRDSRPDVVIESADGGALVWLESKIGSSTDGEQLQHYADLLAVAAGGQKVLVYMTRDHDPQAAGLRLGPTHPRYVEHRWHEVYHFLRAWARQSPYVDDLLAFMREHHMAEPITFTPTRLVAFQQSPETFKVMNAILAGEVETAYKRVLGISDRSKMKDRLDQLIRHNRYAMVWDGNWFDVTLGFSRPIDPDGHPADEPWLLAQISVGKGGNRRAHHDMAVEGFKQHTLTGWQTDASPEWSWMSATAPLSEVLRRGEHIESCQAWFLARIGEIHRFKAANPQLSWADRAEVAAP